MIFKKRKNNIVLNSHVKGDQTSLKIQELLKSSSILIEKLTNSCDAEFEIIDEELMIEINGIRAYIESEEDLFIINEIFNENCYGFHSSENFVLLDIGLNIGLSSLYFSQLAQIKKIYAFEPVSETYQKCLRNLALNDNPIKITPNNKGLGNSNRMEYFTYTEMFKGSVGKAELSEHKKNLSQELKSVEVEITEASAILQQILSENPNQKIMVKMDCEGAEYEIIENLNRSKILDSISLIILEWHGLAFLKQLSNFDNFDCFWNKNSESTGMLYAFNKKG